MGSCEKASASSISSVFTPPIKTIDTPMQHGGTPRATTMRPPAAGYKAPTSDYQVEADKQMPRKDESIVSKALEYMFDEQRSLGSPVSPKPDASAEFLPGFLMGDIPAYVTRHTRPSMGVMDMRSPLLAGGSPPKPVVPSYKDKGGAPPVRSIYDDVNSPLLGSTLLRSRKRVSFSVMQNPLSGTMPLTSGTASSEFNPTTMMQSSKATLSPAQLDLFHTQGHALTSDDQLDDSWVTVFGFSQASASYVLLQFAQYGNIIKHVISNTGNWMHIQYQSKLQARKALSKDERIFGECIMIGVKPCIDKSVMGSCEKESTSSSAYVFTPPITTMRPPAAAYKATSDYQVVADKQMPRKEESFVSKVMECLFGW